VLEKLPYRLRLRLAAPRPAQRLLGLYARAQA